MRTREKWAFAALMLAVSLAPAACTRRDDGSGERLLVWRMPSDPRSLDPALASNSRSQAITRRSHEGLLIPDPRTGAPTAGLAESWEISPDGLRYVFHLRHDVVFDNGTTLTAADVVFSLSRHFDPEVRSSLWPFLESIQGGMDRLEGRADEVSGLQAPDDHTVVVELSSPFAPLLSVLSMAQAGVIPAGAQPGASGEFPGTGPFHLGVCCATISSECTARLRRRGRYRLFATESRNLAARSSLLSVPRRCRLPSDPSRT